MRLWLFFRMYLQLDARLCLTAGALEELPTPGQSSSLSRSTDSSTDQLVADEILPSPRVLPGAFALQPAQPHIRSACTPSTEATTIMVMVALATLVPTP